MEGRERVSGAIQAAERHIQGKLEQLAQIKASEAHRLEFIEGTAQNQVVKVETLQTRLEEVEAGIYARIGRLIQLERTKKNIESMISFAKRLQTIDYGLRQVELLLAQQKYAEVASLFLGLLQLAESMEPMINSTMNIKAILGRVEEMKKVLWNSVLVLFKSHAGVKGGFRPGKADTILLAQATLIVEVLGAEFRKRLIDWYVEMQLKDYKGVYRGNLEYSSLTKLNNRFHWLQRLLNTFKEEHELIFMASWRIPEILSAHFCASTAKDICDMLRLQYGQIEPEVLLAAIRETQGFERGLAQMHPASDPAAFIMSNAFEGHLGLFIQVQEKEFAQFLVGLPVKLEKPGDFDSGNLIGSAPLFFLLIRDCLQDLLSLGSAGLLRELFALFNRFLIEYSRYLQDKLPKRLSMGKLLKTPDFKLVCTLLSTANYCVETSQQLNGQIIQISTEFPGLDTAIQSFHVLSSLCMAQIDLNTEMLLEAAWADMEAMLKAAWNTKHQVGDQSKYVGEIKGVLQNILMQVRKYISRPSTLQQLSSRITRMVFERFRDVIFTSKPISTTGAEQLIVDLSGLKDAFLTLNRIRRQSLEGEGIAALAHDMAILEGMIKTVLLPVEVPKTFFEGYLILVNDPAQATFQRVLQLRSIAKGEMNELLEEFAKFLPETPSGPLQAAKLGQQGSRRQAAPSTTDQVINRLKYFDLEEQVLKKIPLPNLPSSLGVSLPNSLQELVAAKKEKSNPS